MCLNIKFNWSLFEYAITRNKQEMKYKKIMLFEI